MKQHALEYLTDAELPPGPFVGVAKDGVVVGVNDAAELAGVISRHSGRIYGASGAGILESRVIFVLTHDDARVLLRGLQEVVRGEVMALHPDAMPYPGSTEDWEYQDGMEAMLDNIRSEIDMLNGRIAEPDGTTYAQFREKYRGMVAVLRASEQAAQVAINEYRSTPNVRFRRWLRQQGRAEDQ